MDIKAKYLNVDNNRIDTQASCFGAAVGLVALVDACMASASWLTEVTTMPAPLAWVLVLTLGLTLILPAAFIFALVVKYIVAIFLWCMTIFWLWIKSFIVK